MTRKLNFSEINSDTKIKILRFLNHTDFDKFYTSIQDNPAVTKGKKSKKDYAIGKTIAEKIISYKDKNGEITSLDFLNDIKGFGQDKLLDLAYTVENQNKENNYLSMLAHPTDGSDKIHPGIHLRWMFHHKLGFPSRGFMLYRRETASSARYCLAFNKIDQESITLPYEHMSSSGKSIILSSDVTDTLKLEEITFSNGTKYNSLLMDSPINVAFLPKTSIVEITFFLPVKSELKITAWSNYKKVWEHIFDDYKEGEKTITISAYEISHIKILCSRIYITNICSFVCEDDDNWELVNDKCGFGLPYDEDIFNCRLEPDVFPELQGDNYKHLGHIISLIEKEGTHIPVGWNSMNVPGNNNKDTKNENAPEFQISAYDLLLMQIMDPYFARGIGLYWLDRDAEDDIYYDYKIVTDWPEDTLAKLDYQVCFEKYEKEQMLTHLFANETNEHPVFYIDTESYYPIVTECDSDFAKVTRGIAFYPRLDQTITLVFNRPITEIQIFIKQGGLRTVLKARGIFGEIYESELTQQEGVLAVHGKNILSVTLTGSYIIILRVHYDCETINRGEYNFRICGIKKDTPIPLQPPENLETSCLLGGVSETEENEKPALRYRAGLRWDLCGDLNEVLLSNAPVAYHIKRTDPRNDTKIITQDHPVKVAPGNIMNNEETLSFKGYQGCYGNRVTERQFYIDLVNEKGEYFYAAASLDLFGRQSEFCEPERVHLKSPLPPPPVDVRAKYCDYTTYDPETKTFSDPALSEEEKFHLLRYSKIEQSFIHVSWKWPENQQKMAPDALGFRIYMIHGWLNIITGFIYAVRKIQYEGENNELKDGYEVDTHLAVQEGSLINEWLRQDQFLYKIVDNTGGSNSTLTLTKTPEWAEIPDEIAMPKENRTFIIKAIKPEQENGAAVNYNEPSAWGDHIDIKNIISQDQVEYEIYIPVNREVFPDFEETDGYVQEKIKYAQVGVNTFIDSGDGEEEDGSVSQPATIMAVYREKPEDPVITDQTDQYHEGITLKATPADYYGKSSFSFLWPGSGDPKVKYNVYRAMDQTLFLVDKANRERNNRSINVYSQILNNFNFELSPEDKSNFKSDDPDYEAFTNNMLKALANLADNTDAFAKLNEKPVRKQAPDPGMLIYKDNSLDGRGDNKYFYRVRPVDDIGNLGNYSNTTMPVECPKVTPSRPPNIKIVNGDRQITLKWSASPGVKAVQYKIYRTDDRYKAKDWRRMSLINENAKEQYIADLSESNRLEFSDTTIEPFKKYYYGIRAKDKYGLVTKLSDVCLGIAYDYGEPDEPVWIRAEWIKLDDNLQEHSHDETVDNFVPAIALEFSVNKSDISAIIKRKQGDGNYINVSSWQKPLPDNNSWKICFYDTSAEPEKEYSFRTKLINKAGLIFDSQAEQLVEALNTGGD